MATIAINPTCPVKEYQRDDLAILDIPAVPKHQSFRRVRFAADENDSQSPAHRALTSEMISELWYTHEEVTKFKNDIRSLVIRQVQKGDLPKEEMMGLEKYNPQRSEFKKSAKYHILHAQRQNQDPEFLRSVSRRCTAWARAIARDQGFQDFCAVSDPLDGLLELENFESVMQEIATSTQKRNRDEESQPTSKRQRLS
ncbi:MAG: hypothetical protein SGBAC_010696 [Bacillariaceae sp.]